MARYDRDVTFTASDAKIATGTSVERNSEIYDAAADLRVQLDVTAVTGTTPTLDVVIEDTIDGTNWNVIGTFAQKVAAGREVINITNPFTGRLRVRWTVGGTTPSFTFSVLGRALGG